MEIERDDLRLLYALIKDMSKPNLVNLNKLYDEAEKYFIGKQEAMKMIDRLKMEGMIFQADKNNIQMV